MGWLVVRPFSQETSITLHFIIIAFFSAFLSRLIWAEKRKKSAKVNPPRCHSPRTLAVGRARVTIFNEGIKSESQLQSIWGSLILAVQLQNERTWVESACLCGCCYLPLSLPAGRPRRIICLVRSHSCSFTRSVIHSFIPTCTVESLQGRGLNSILACDIFFCEFSAVRKL